MTSDTDAHGFTDPLDLVDRIDLPYERRLEMLQEWRARLTGSDAPRAEVEAIDGAIQALEMGARVQGDESDEVPDDQSSQRAH